MNFFEQIINVLVLGAIVLTVIKTYLTANKVWSRKHKKDVAESISVSAQLIGIMTSLPFLIKYMIIESDYMSFANMSIKLGLTLFFLMIGIGLWVKMEGNEGFWAKVKRSLKLEKQESMDLINALIRPAGASVILEVLQKLAVVDKKLDEKEMEFIQNFADNWGIRIDFKEEFELVAEQNTEQLHVELRSMVVSYLALSPDQSQASQFLDILITMVGVDSEVDAQEQFILAEIKGLIEAYIHEGEARTTFNVIVVPQDSEERSTIQTLLPNVTPRAEWGGVVYYAGKFYSRPFAEMISQKYQHLNLFSTVKSATG
ncbi:MAG: hypothetical protein ACI9MF_002812 [Gammaproteobacteria bacterium]|jgi:hypothetical protein